MKEEYQPLFTPWKIGNLEIKNRIVLAPMGGTCIFGWTEPNHFDKEAAKLLMRIAENNCGLIIPGIAPVKDILMGAWLYQHKWKFDQLKEFMDELHKTGAKMFIQMTAGFGRSMALSDMMMLLINNKALGTVAKPFLNPEYLSAAPSETPNRWVEGYTTRALTKKEIQDIVYAFGETARLCKEAGVDGLEVHAVHEGYVLDQFTLPYANFRTDEYGGSFENRYRFATDIVKEIKGKCGKDFPVSLRYSVVSHTKGYQEGALPGETDYIEVGRTMEESEKAVKYLQDAGYDMLNCDNGTYDAWYWAHPPQYMPENCNLEEVSHIKKFCDIPVACAGRMTPEAGAKAIAAGDIDAMVVGRQFLADQAWLTKLINDQPEEILPCICCHNGCFDMAKHNGTGCDQDFFDTQHMCMCAVNPQTMQSKKYKIEPTKKPKKVAVIGGGIGGMEAARVLKLRGHNPTIYEKSDKLGGIFIAAAAPDFKEHDKRLIEWFKLQINKLGIPVKFNTEVTDVTKLDADAVVVATGAKANVLRIPGAEKAISAVEYLLGEKEVGDNVVIIGGGLTGCEMALDLYNKGKHPVIVEMVDDLIAVPNLCLANSSFLRDFFKTNNVPVYLKTKTKEIGDGYVLCETDTMKQFKIDADSVIYSIGYKPQPVVPAGYNFDIAGKTLPMPDVCAGVMKKVDPLLKSFTGISLTNTDTKAGNKPVYLVGDCDKVGNLRKVIWGAWDVAMKI
ncbi:MAG: FAD-dependent oxidoreductase [Clostridia bacterium]|nr:FAD-dependent oxidoreductase [Clostridia bacterium]